MHFLISWDPLHTNPSKKKIKAAVFAILEAPLFYIFAFFPFSERLQNSSLPTLDSSTPVNISSLFLTTMISSTVNSIHLKPSFAFFLPSKSNGIDLNSGHLIFREQWKHSMSQDTKAFIRNGALRINGRKPLVSVPENVVVTPSSNGSLFLGAVSPQASSRHVFKLGIVKDFQLLSLFRFKIWWMIPRIGNSGSDIPAETQLLLLEAKANGDGSPNADKTLPFYILFLPVLDGQFRSSLQGNSSNELEFCIESGRDQP